MKLKKIFFGRAALVAIAIFFLAGCTTVVNTNLSEKYSQVRPYRVAVAPVIWEGWGDEDKDASRLFRTMTAEKLRNMNYDSIPLEQIDRAYPDSASLKAADAASVARSLDADAVLYIHLTQWDSSELLTYASLKMAATYEMYYKDGGRLWQASYHTKEADIRLDTPSMELALLKAFEPRVQRFVDVIFTALPQGQAPSKDERFFQWLP